MNVATETVAHLFQAGDLVKVTGKGIRIFHYQHSTIAVVSITPKGRLSNVPLADIEPIRWYPVHTCNPFVGSTHCQGCHPPIGTFYRTSGGYRR